MSNFGECVEIVLRFEGIDSDHPLDPGGLTKFGISSAAYPDLDIENLTRQEAVAIYKRDYWDKVQGDKLPAGLDLLAFDMAVNAGVTAASKLLQHMVGAHPDGDIGSKTLARVNATYTSAQLRYYTARRITHYSSLPSWRVFGHGWTLRSLNAYQRALGMSLRNTLDTNLEK